MQRNNYNTHSNSISTANKAGFVLGFFHTRFQLKENYEVIIVLFHNQTLKSLATEEM